MAKSFLIRLIKKSRGVCSALGPVLTRTPLPFETERPFIITCPWLMEYLDLLRDIVKWTLFPTGFLSELCPLELSGVTQWVERWRTKPKVPGSTD